MSVSVELRLAADKLTSVPRCDEAGCTCECSVQLAGLFRDAAARHDEDAEFPVHEIALDLARRINRTEVSR